MLKLKPGMPEFMSGIFIDVANGRARFARLSNGDGFDFEFANNSNDLQDDLAQAVSDLGAYITMSGQYPCPAELAAKAKWGPRSTKMNMIIDQEFRELIDDNAGDLGVSSSELVRHAAALYIDAIGYGDALKFASPRLPRLRTD